MLNIYHFLSFFVGIAVSISVCHAEEHAENAFDARIEQFLSKNSTRWHDMNVPYSDGKVLHDIILENKYTRALEIGTSTGHSSIWIAWALRKTGGKLITIEINEERHREALRNFEETGLSRIIDARLGNAHDIVPKLEGPFDFVFSDADKDWYTNYLKAVYPKLADGGCFTAHNVLNRYSGIRDFLEYLDTLPDMETTIVRSSPSGVSVSYKKSRD